VTTPLGPLFLFFLSRSRITLPRSAAWQNVDLCTLSRSSFFFFFSGTKVQEPALYRFEFFFLSAFHLDRRVPFLPLFGAPSLFVVILTDFISGRVCFHGFWFEEWFPPWSSSSFGTFTKDCEPLGGEVRWAWVTVWSSRAVTYYVLPFLLFWTVFLGLTLPKSQLPLLSSLKKFMGGVGFPFFPKVTRRVF